MPGSSCCRLTLAVLVDGVRSDQTSERRNVTFGQQSSSMEFTTANSWGPVPRTAKWLLIGILALMVDACLSTTGSVLELKFWDHDGFNAGTLLRLVGILPQILVLNAYLTLARDAHARGLWKSTAGVYACFWVGQLLAISFVEDPPKQWANVCAVASGFGIVGILLFLFSRIPRFEAKPNRNEPDAVDSEESEEESKGGGCFGHAIIFALVILVRMLARNNRLGGFDIGADEWKLIGLVVIGLLSLIFVLWSAVAKIRLREQLGPIAALVGGMEIVVVLLHLAMVSACAIAMISAIADNPNLGDKQIDALFDPWGRAGTIISSVCYVVWALLTAWFFSSIRGLSESEWRRRELLGPNRY